MCVLYHSTLIHKIGHMCFSRLINLNQIENCTPNPCSLLINPPTVVPPLVAAQLLSAYLSLFFSSAPSDLTNSPVDLDGHLD